MKQTTHQPDTYNNHWNKSGNNKANINGQVCEPNEPPVASPGLELSGALRATYGAGGILSADTDTEEEAIGGESCQHTVDTSVRAIRTSRESCKDELPRTD